VLSTLICPTREGAEVGSNVGSQEGLPGGGVGGVVGLTVVGVAVVGRVVGDMVGDVSITFVVPLHEVSSEQPCFNTYSWHSSVNVMGPSFEQRPHPVRL
jgi:hypothetical protein